MYTKKYCLVKQLDDIESRLEILRNTDIASTNNTTTKYYRHDPYMGEMLVD